MFYKLLVRPWLFQADPEAAHDRAYEKIRAGASLVEVWTGVIYEGPAIVRNFNRGLLRLLERDGFGSMAGAVGAE